MRGEEAVPGKGLVIRIRVVVRATGHLGPSTPLPEREPASLLVTLGLGLLGGNKTAWTPKMADQGAGGDQLCRWVYDRQTGHAVPLRSGCAIQLPLSPAAGGLGD